MSTIQRRIIIGGKVQGVGFRRCLLNETGKFTGIRGYVRNLTDGRVEAVFVGADDDVYDLLMWCENGPPQARVSEFEVVNEPVDPKLGPFNIVDY